MKSGTNVFIIEFGAGHFKEITYKVLRKSMVGEKSGSSGLSYLKQSIVDACESCRQ